MTNTTLNLIAILLAILVGFEGYDRAQLYLYGQRAEQQVESLIYQECMSMSQTQGMTQEVRQRYCRDKANGR